MYSRCNLRYKMIEYATCDDAGAIPGKAIGKTKERNGAQIMADIIQTFGKAIGRLAADSPARSRQLLVTGLKAFRGVLRYAPDKRLPPSRQYSAVALNRVMCHVLDHAETSALVSVFQPCELLEAMEITPMCAEMLSAYINGSQAEAIFADAAENEGIAETYCSYHRVLLGTAYLNVLPKPAMVVNTSLVCDANHLTFRELAARYNVPHYYVDVPPEQSEESVAYVADQFRDLAGFLQEHLGRRLEKQKLRETMVRSKRTVESLRACLSEKKAHSLSGDVTSEMYEIYLSHNGLGSPAAEQYADTLLRDLRAAPPARGIRLLWLHTIPVWQTPVKELFDLNDRCQIVTCDMCTESLTDVDPDLPYESMARRLVYSPWNGGQKRVGAALALADELQVDGVICFCHWGCKQTMGLSALFKSELEKAGFPTLILNGDGCDRRNSSDGQTATRLNAFLEMLEGLRYG